MSQPCPGIFRSIAFVGLICLIAVVGCAEGANETLVQGTVSLDSELLDHGAIRFFGADGSRPVSAGILSDGTYEVRLPPGSYQVSIDSPSKAPPNKYPNDDTPPPPVRNSFPPRYTQIKTSGLTVVVGAQAEPQEWDIDLP